MTASPYYVAMLSLSEMAALGPASPQVRRVFVITPQKNGGQLWDWDPISTATANGKWIVQADGVATGRWILNGCGQFTAVNYKTVYNIDDTGTFDVHSDIQNAIDSFSGGQGNVFLTPGTFKTTSPLVCAQNAMGFTGVNPFATTLLFNPTGHDQACVKYSKGAAVSFQGNISGFRVASADSTYRKIAIEAEDISATTIQNIVVSSFNGGSGSIGVLVGGRELSTFQNMTLQTERPFVLRQNPNDSGGNEDSNEFVVRDVELVSTSTAGKCFEIEDGVGITGLTLQGRFTCVHGKYGIYWNNTLQNVSSDKLDIQSLWFEQPDDPTGYMIYINQQTGIVRNLSIENFSGPAAPCGGIFLRGIAGWEGVNGHITGTGAYNALDFDNTVLSSATSNVHLEAGTVVNITGQNLLWAGPQYDGGSPIADFNQWQSTASLGSPGPVIGTGARFLGTINAASLPTVAGASGTLWVDTGAANVIKRVP